MIVGVALPVVYRPPEFDRINFCTLIVNYRMIMLFSRSEFIMLSREDRKRGQFRHKSFYRSGIASCLATSHKQILKTPCSMTSSCILGFQATRPPTTGCQIKGKGVSTQARLFSALVINNRRA